MDVNQHVNNVKYIGWILEVIVTIFKFSIVQCVLLRERTTRSVLP